MYELICYRNFLFIILKSVIFFVENASCPSKIMLENGADNNTSFCFQKFRSFIVNLQNVSLTNRVLLIRQ